MATNTHPTTESPADAAADADATVEPTYDHGRASSNVRAVIDDRGEWDWMLYVTTAGDVQAVKSVPYDGQRYIRGDLADVVAEYVAATDTPYDAAALRQAAATGVAGR